MRLRCINQLSEMVEKNGEEGEDEGGRERMLKREEGGRFTGANIYTLLLPTYGTKSSRGDAETMDGVFSFPMFFSLHGAPFILGTF